MGIFSRLVTVANPIETPILWIHEIELKMVQVWPTSRVALFSIGLSRLAF
jgi:hypothetical protein